MPSFQGTDNRLAAPDTQYDAPVFEPQSNKTLTPEQLAQQLVNVDVVVVGEYHGHHGSHLLQSRLQAALYRQTPEQVLSLEQFNLDAQDELDRYLRGNAGETEMIEDAGAWDNYRGSYRPLVEFARQRNLPVVAANAPADIVRCVGRKGPEYLDTVPAPTRQALPATPFMDTPAYRGKFMAAMGVSHQADSTMSERMENTYKAQLLRDNTMAARIVEALKEHPQHQVLHLTGTFHSEEGLGTVALLRQRAPELSVAVVSPVFWPAAVADAPVDENRSKGDFLYFIQPLPGEFLDPEREREAMRARFRSATDKTCN
ncbi:ChaN family lipoprotein [Marinobacter sp. F3R08]|uniref:ChaN family lipoprotein n=1 Tax=Marinobacter sp. F3R08 TaxID=2841559 RepID=UPI001C09DBFF|nr:ChaN family lipoprotein [Marinobacter sp. F3R08]MBU2953316.1 ChaN family lipoprotein [Marinobacter sp. F3R08]